MKINQALVTQSFQCRNGTSGMYYEPEDLRRIQEVLRKHHNVFISESEAIDFWHWRSEQWDSSWLSMNYQDDEEILDFFTQFLGFIGVEPDEDEEEKVSETPTKVGVKVVVKDSDGVPWEVELDPEYHSQIIGEIESQIPGEKTEGGSIRFKIDYNPDKILNMRKLEEK